MRVDAPGFAALYPGYVPQRVSGVPPMVSDVKPVPQRSFVDSPDSPQTGVEKSGTHHKER
jgi:hypothetical protein